MSKQPYLHIPRPTARPGDKPDFSYLRLSPAGAVVGKGAGMGEVGR